MSKCARTSSAVTCSSGFGLPNGRCVDQYIQPAKAGQARGNHLPHVAFARQIALDGNRLDAASFQIGDGFGRLGGRRVIVNRHRIAALGQRLDHVPADSPSAPAGDQCNLAHEKNDSSHPQNARWRRAIVAEQCSPCPAHGRGSVVAQLSPGIGRIKRLGIKIPPLSWSIGLAWQAKL